MIIMIIDSWRMSYKYLEAVIGHLFISNSVLLISGQFQPHGTCTYFAQSHCNVPHAAEGDFISSIAEAGLSCSWECT